VLPAHENIPGIKWKGGIFFSIITAISSLPAKTPNGDVSYFYMKKVIQYSCEKISNNDSVDSQVGFSVLTALLVARFTATIFSR